MARSQISLKDWCAKDSLLKAEFLKKESQPNSQKSTPKNIDENNK